MQQQHKHPELEVHLPAQEHELAMLDMFSGCGALSMGLEMGGPLAGVTILTVSSIPAVLVSLKILQILSAAVNPVRAKVSIT